MVWGEGNPNSSIMIILDNPGARENPKGQSFVCGTRETLQQSLYFAYDHHKLGLVSTTLIMYGIKLIGFYAARVGNLEVEDETEFKKLKSESIIPAVELTHFAMHKDYAGHGIGTEVIVDLIGDLIEANSYMAIRYLFCWSVKSEKTLHFYEKKNGFIRMKKEKDDTVLMRFAIPDSNDINEISKKHDEFLI